MLFDIMNINPAEWSTFWNPQFLAALFIIGFLLMFHLASRAGNGKVTIRWQ